MDATPTGTHRASTVGVAGSDRPRLARHARLGFDRTRQRRILLHPEAVVVLNDTGAAVLDLCDGRRTVAAIVSELGGRYQRVPEAEVRQFLSRLVARRYVELGEGRGEGAGDGDG
ncbi:pyrroloquinoline quinone biosynthesis peptide chaperone PqqD [Streptomyces sp. NPDC014983]|uniref:pyrroloquinoline quinone biosynthesis peptide chaperone PqqD n=1 Tax=Streptomyces sp. NPDC014983 TaxID=3364933 RepID=UPI0036FA7CCB